MLAEIILLKKVDQYDQSRYKRYAHNVNNFIVFAVNLQVFAEGKEIVKRKQTHNNPEKPANMVRTKT